VTDETPFFLFSFYICGLMTRIMVLIAWSCPQIKRKKSVSGERRKSLRIAPALRSGTYMPINECQESERDHAILSLAII